MKKGLRHTERKTDDKNVELERGQRAGRGKKKKPGTERREHHGRRERKDGAQLQRERERR